MAARRVWVDYASTQDSLALAAPHVLKEDGLRNVGALPEALNRRVLPDNVQRLVVRPAALGGWDGDLQAQARALSRLLRNMSQI